jgi:DNA-binding response OmpR family regulator
MRVLVVDDNPDLRDSLSILLVRLGYDAEGARDGQQAMDIQRSRPADILITDIFMPGKDGIETIEAFRREWPRIRIVAMSGGGAIAMRDYLEVAPDIGADAVLRKPFTLEHLQAALRSVDGAGGRL